MKAVLQAATLAALAVATAGCQVNVDENTAARMENAADRLESAADGAATSIENVAEGAAAKVENAADRLDSADVDVKVKARDGNEAAANRQ
jgi:hypothetical protein